MMNSLMHQSCDFEGDAVLDRQPSRSLKLLCCWIGGQDRARDGWRHSVHVEVALGSTLEGRRGWRYNSPSGIRQVML